MGKYFKAFLLHETNSIQETKLHDLGVRSKDTQRIIGISCVWISELGMFVNVLWE